MKKRLIAQIYFTEVINMRINEDSYRDTTLRQDYESRKEHSKCETEVQGRIIQSMNNTIVELREQLTETEEKYNELLKHIANEK